MLNGANLTLSSEIHLELSLQTINASRLPQGTNKNIKMSLQMDKRVQVLMC